MLVGDRIVAAIDLKADRANRKLLVQQWTWLDGGPAEGDQARLDEALHRFERVPVRRLNAGITAARPSPARSAARRARSAPTSAAARSAAIISADQICTVWP